MSDFPLKSLIAVPKPNIEATARPDIPKNSLREISLSISDDSCAFIFRDLF